MYDQLVALASTPHQERQVGLPSEETLQQVRRPWVQSAASEGCVAQTTFPVMQVIQLQLEMTVDSCV
jgi:hypothetical protein